MRSNADYFELFCESSAVHRQCTKGHDGRLHIHDVYEVLLPLSGDVTLRLGESTYKVQHPSVLIFNQSDLHATYVPKPQLYDRYVFYFSPELMNAYSTVSTFLLDCFVRRPEPLCQILPLNYCEYRKLVLLFDELVETNTCETDAFGNDILRYSLACQLLVHLNRLYHVHHKLAYTPNEQVAKSAYRVLQFINAHYTETLDLETISQATFLSTTYLCRVFKNTFGVTPMRYTTRLRIARAKLYLLSGHTVKETASLVGYNSVANFTKQFKKETTYSPQQYKREHPDLD